MLESWHCSSIVHLPQQWVGESRKDEFSGWVSVVGVVILSYMHYHHTQGQSGHAPPVFGWGTLSRVFPIIWGVKLSLILDFVVFYFTKTHFTLMLTKKLPPGPLPGLCPWISLEDLFLSCCVPCQLWRQMMPMITLFSEWQEGHFMACKITSANVLRVWSKRINRVTR